MKYAHIFANTTERDNYVFSNNYVEPFVGVVRQDEEDSLTAYNRFYDTDITDYLSETPFTIGILSAGNFTVRSNNAAWSKTVEYQKNDGNWTSINITTAATSLSVVPGDKISFRGDNDTYAEWNSNGVYQCTFGSYESGTTCRFIAYGNVMSLISKSSFSTLSQFTSPGVFGYMFSCAYYLEDASGLILPSTNLTNLCYNHMFNATGIKYPPKLLPAKRVAQSAYGGMFTLSSNLIEPPEIQALSVLSNGCSEMFYNCSSLKKAPSLIAQNVGTNGYWKMFNGCSNIDKIVSFISNPNTDGNTTDWLNGVSSTGLFFKLSNVDTSLFPRDANGIPAGWEFVNMPSN